MPLWRPDRLRFGPAGIPLRAKARSTKQGVLEVKALGLDAMEIEFVRRISLTEQSAREVAAIARELDVALTVHAPYYVNLASPDKSKAEASAQRVYQSAVIGYAAGAWSVCFHAAYYMGKGSEEVYSIVKEALKGIIAKLKDEGVEIWLRPETTGSPTEFGTLDELLKLSSELEMVMPVIDFAHLHARSNGAFNSYEEFGDVLSRIEDALGREALGNMHIHVSGIEYGEKGEVRHLNLQESDLEYEDLVRALKDFNVKGVLISESPNLEEDALTLKKLFESL
ncbi:MAG: TIM barrel protein [Thermofilum sp.]|nr:TIM barrel protein [Thermofilum sp.]